MGLAAAEAGGQGRLDDCDQGKRGGGGNGDGEAKGDGVPIELVFVCDAFFAEECEQAS